MNPSGFVTGWITWLMHGLDDFMERDCDRARARGRKGGRKFAL